MRLVTVGQRLGLDPLGGVDQQDRSLAGGQRPADLVPEVDVARGVDEVEGVVLPADPHVLRLDGDAPLPLDVHRVEVLLSHQPGIDRPGQLQDAVGQRGLAVVDVADDGEIADLVDGKHGLLSVQLAGRGPGRGSWPVLAGPRPVGPGRSVLAAWVPAGRSWPPGSRPVGPGRLGPGRWVLASGALALCRGAEGHVEAAAAGPDCPGCYPSLLAGHPPWGPGGSAAARTQPSGGGTEFSSMTRTTRGQHP